jgi:hypothetical protein
MPTTSTARAQLQAYIEADEDFYALYEAYSPVVAVLMRINAALPAAYVLVASRRSCSDCLRNVPPMARIAEHLTGWTWDIYNDKDQPERSASLAIRAVPTFIVYDRQGGRELGRIIENPASGSLETDLLHIVQAAR